MKKVKLINTRKAKGYLLSDMAEQLGIDESNYSRRENGQKRISQEEWEKLAQALDVSTEEIFEPEDNIVFINKDHATVNANYHGNNNVYTVPESMFDNQQKYIQMLEAEIKDLKERLKDTNQ